MASVARGVSQQGAGGEVSVGCGCFDLEFLKGYLTFSCHSVTKHKLVWHSSPLPTAGQPVGQLARTDKSTQPARSQRIHPDTIIDIYIHLHWCFFPQFSRRIISFIWMGILSITVVIVKVRLSRVEVIASRSLPYSLICLFANMYFNLRQYFQLSNISTADVFIYSC